MFLNQFLALIPLQLVEWVSRDKRRLVKSIHQSPRTARRFVHSTTVAVLPQNRLADMWTVHVSVLVSVGMSDLDCLLFRCCLTYSEMCALADECRFDLHLYLASTREDHTR